MDIISNMLLANMPDGFWQNLIGIVVDFVGNYGLAIIIFTILLKIVLSPLDFMQKKITKNNTEKQAKLKPKLDKLNKKYKDNKEMLNQKTMELYKKENYNILGSCFGMILNLVLTLFIFITLFGAMRNIGEFKIADQYNELAVAYKAETTIEDSEAAVIAKYEEIKEDFLWIENVWRPDTNASIIPNYENFLKLTKLSEDSIPTEEEYNQVMGVLETEYGGWNGLYILVILSALVTFFSQKIMQGHMKPKEELAKGTDDTPQPNTKFMLYLMPGLMLVITIQYSAAFALYIVTNSIVTAINSIVSYKILQKIDAKKEITAKAEYSR